MALAIVTGANRGIGLALTELLKQGQYSPVPVEEQVISIFAGVRGFLDGIKTADVGRFEAELLRLVRGKHADILTKIRTEKQLSADTEKALTGVMQTFAKSFA